MKVQFGNVQAKAAAAFDRFGAVGESRDVVAKLAYLPFLCQLVIGGTPLQSLACRILKYPALCPFMIHSRKRCRNISAARVILLPGRPPTQV